MGFSHLFNDRILKLIYNASAWEQEEDAGMRAFLQFVSRNEASDDLTDGLLESVAEVKRNEIFRKEYMSMGVWETDIRDIAKQQGAQEKALETARNALNLGLSIEQTAQITSLPLEEVKQLAMEVERESVQV